jgi:hypothetical protein
MPSTQNTCALLEEARRNGQAALSDFPDRRLPAFTKVAEALDLIDEARDELEAAERGN